MNMADRKNDPNAPIDPEIYEGVAKSFNAAFETGIATEGGAKYAAQGVQHAVLAYQTRNTLVDAMADASHGAQQPNAQGEVLNPAQKAENDARETLDRVDKQKELYQQEKNAIAEQQKAEDYQQKSFQQKANDLNAQFEKSNQQQLEYKNQQDQKYKDLAGENAKVNQDLTALNESARQEHAKWREGKADALCKDEATAQVNNKIDQRVGEYKNRIEEMGSKFMDGNAMAEKYKVQLEEKKPEQVEQKAAELKQENFKSIDPPSVAAPSVGSPSVGSPSIQTPSLQGPGNGSGPGGGR
jgi:myosin heavy subunit